MRIFGFYTNNFPAAHHEAVHSQEEENFAARKEVTYNST
jgi:hypothetical protein